MPDDKPTPIEYASPMTSSRQGPSPDFCAVASMLCYALGASIVAVSGMAWLADGMYFAAIRRGVIGLALGIGLCLAGRWFDKRKQLDVRSDS